MPELLLGIDIGTYSSKGVLVSPDGTVLKSHVVEHVMDIPHPGWAEQDADAIWWHDCVALCRVLLDGSPYSGADVAGVAVSAIGPCMLPLDKAGKPLRKGLLYGVDARASAEIEELNELYGEESLFAETRMALTSQAVGPKIRWMRRNEPHLWAQVDKITTASSYLIYKLTGEHVIDLHTASHYIPSIDMQTLQWSDKYAQTLVDPAKLPRLMWSDQVAGAVSASGASETGLRAGTPVAVGAVDALSEGISVGVVQPGDLMIMYGSTTFFIIVLEKPTADKRVWTTAGAYAGQYNLAAGMATTGALTRWFRDTLASNADYATLFREAEAIGAGAGGLLVLPYFSGERTPINDPQARGMLMGLTLAHTRAHVFRAILESVAYGIRHNIETFRNIGAPIQRVVAVGGGTQSREWLQIVSDVANVPQILPALTIGASYGDAFLAGVAAGVFGREHLKQWVKVETVIEPRPNPTYNALYADYLSLYEQTKGIAHRLGKFAV